MDKASGSASEKAHSCATSESLPWDTISSCFSGDQGKELLKQAALYFDKRFPDPVGVPHIEINGKIPVARDYSTLIKELCQTGISAGACSGQSTVVV
mmetsp:Transcript_87271/g.151032  ORF Transcript_87271/g.151032 Transcript_87271/m.151032 type:complete len:97 (-) Transcript_87271:156-446(-)